jgi:hypothetical protein
MKMEKVNRERYEMVAGALRDIGIRDFLIIALRKTKTCKDDEMESFYCLSAGDRANLVMALRNVFINNPDIGELLISILHEVYHSAAMGITAAGTGPMARA